MTKKKRKISQFLANEKSLNFSKELAESMGYEIDLKKTKELSDTLHDKYFQDVIKNAEIHVVNSKFFSGSIREITSFVSPENKESEIFFDQQMDFWLLDMAHLNTIAACKILNDDEFQELENIFDETLETFINPYKHEDLREKFKPLFFNHPDCFKLAHGISKSMIAFVICHELAHINLNHTKLTHEIEHEFEADELATKYYLKMIENTTVKDLIYVEKQFLKLPILLLNYFGIIEKYNFAKFAISPSRKTHPSPIERAERIFNQVSHIKDEKADYFLEGYFLGLKDLIEHLNLPKKI